MFCTRLSVTAIQKIYTMNYIRSHILLYVIQLSTPEDDYVSFMVYLRTNSVWETVSDVFRMLNETRPEDPIEFFKANVKIDNCDNRAIEETRRKITEAEEKLKILRYDKQVLTANLDLLDKTIHVNRKPNLGVRSTVDYVEHDNETISETFSYS